MHNFTSYKSNRNVGLNVNDMNKTVWQLGSIYTFLRSRALFGSGALPDAGRRRWSTAFSSGSHNISLAQNRRISVVARPHEPQNDVTLEPNRIKLGSL